MQILAHRGYWNTDIQSNSQEALLETLKMGYGFESDIRDYMEKLVISHNIATKESFDADTVFKALQAYENQYCFAINVKADGLIQLLKAGLEKYGITNYFAFDMSVPQMIEYRAAGITYFTRQSEYEMLPVLYEDAAGVWIDAFEDETWINETLIQKHLENGKKVCIVSPDLHQRSYIDMWKLLKNINCMERESIMLCTDYPDHARDFFYGKGSQNA